MARPTNGTGQGGKSFQDRELASKVRTKALDDVYLILNDDKKVEKFSELKKQMLLKMSTSILPRLNEHTGRDGEDLFPSPLLGGESNGGNNNGNKKTPQTKKED